MEPFGTFIIFYHFSGMFPLHKSGACDMGGGYIRAHITIKPQFGRKQQVKLKNLYLFNCSLSKYKYATKVCMPC